MAIIKLKTAELNDILEVLHQRGLEYAISYEPGVAFLYGAENMVEQVDDILWARQVMPFDYAKAANMGYVMPEIG